MLAKRVEKHLETLTAGKGEDFGMLRAELATRIAEKSPLVLKLLKRTLRQGLEMPLPAALAHEQAMIGLVLDSNDAHEGCRAFLEKRKAEFKGQ